MKEGREALAVLIAIVMLGENAVPKVKYALLSGRCYQSKELDLGNKKR
ncbi:MAG: hypothetical protein IJA10_15685 [Lachnospiraceae bacterium]|nr:hypothetical protein [Lachnospiraceae bacterium]